MTEKKYNREMCRLYVKQIEKEIQGFELQAEEEGYKFNAAIKRINNLAELKHIELERAKAGATLAIAEEERGFDA